MKVLISILLGIGTLFAQSVPFPGPVMPSAVAIPIDLPGAGTYYATQSVTLTDATGGAVICYRTDGGTPTASTPGTCDAPAITYSGAFNIAVTSTLEAIGTEASLANSPVLTSIYTIFDPSQISGLQAWYAADSGLTCTGSCISGNPVTGWADKSSNANDLTAVVPGLYESAQINGKPAVLFSGSSFYALTSSINLQTDLTIFAVIQLQTTSCCNGLIGGGNFGNGAMEYRFAWAGTIEQGANVPDVGNIGFGLASVDENWHQANITFVSGTLLLGLRIDEASDGPGAVGAISISQNETAIGCGTPNSAVSSCGGDGFNGNIAEIIIYNAILDGTQNGEVEGYLNMRYGI
jgi:hypothetical protein